MKKIVLIHALNIVFIIMSGISCTRKSEGPAPVLAEQATAPATISPSSASGSSGISGPTGPSGTTASVTLDLTADASGLSKSVFVLKTGKGTVRFKLYSKDAPKTAARFAELVQSKFYNGLAFHRVVPGFVAQTGDPYSRSKGDSRIGTGGSGVKLAAEINNRHHIRGALAMARAKALDSADSQFYFTLGSFPHLDKEYTVFGQVTDFGEKVDGKDVLDRIILGDEIVDLSIE